MKKLFKITLLAFMAFLCTYTYAQDNVKSPGKLRIANDLFERNRYVEAIEIYEEVANKGFSSVELFQKLADAKYLNAKYKDAAKWYDELYKLTKQVPLETHRRYSQALKVSGRTKEAEKYFNKYATATRLPKAIEGKGLIDANSGRFSINKLQLNSNSRDYGTSFYGDKIVFSSTRESKKKSHWDGQPRSDLYEATVNPEDGTVGNVTKINSDINTENEEAVGVITKDGYTMYFTRAIGVRINKENQKVPHLKIFRTTYINGRWTREEDLSINSENYSVAHPALSPKEDKLYFSSNMPGTIGNSDLYVVEIFENGSLGTPINLGSEINTQGRESFPYITEDNELYFSTDGRLGLGGLDVFQTTIKKDGFGEIYNLGAPINSNHDDFSFVIKDKKGYLSSNRDNLEGLDNIYSFVELKPLNYSRLFGVVTDIDTYEPLENATLELLDDKSNIITTLKSDENGYYESDLVNLLDSYQLRASKENYSRDEAHSPKNLRDREHDFQLKTTVVSPENNEVISFEKGVDLGKELNIIIYFDLDKSNIRPDAAVELEKLVVAMKERPDLEVDVRSHTDSRSRDAYNLALSDRRAKSTIAYLISRGISSDRLSGKGYGESQLINRCKNGVKCSKAEHQENRRSEFIIK